MKNQYIFLILASLISISILTSCLSNDSKKKRVPVNSQSSSQQPTPANTGKESAAEEIVVLNQRDKKSKSDIHSIPPASPQAMSIVGIRKEMSRPAPPQQQSTENYQRNDESPIKVTQREPVSTFSIDVDTGSYSNVRRFLQQGQLPPKDAVRIEELINYFPYTNTTKKTEHPFGVQTELAPAPWNREHQLLRVRIQAMEATTSTLPACNFVFLVDVSGSMDSYDKLPLVKNSLKMLTKKLRAEDRISLVVYAGRTHVELEPTPGDKHDKIFAAIDKLQAAGSTAGESAMKLAYQMARSSYIPNGINRILMATDGDFNVGLSNIDQLKDMVAAERKTGISLTTLGFGQGNYNDHLMEQIADAGNGNYSYIDSADEARKVLLEEMTSTFNTVAADVKVQIEFNPAQIAEYRLIGYENRMLKEEDFNNDKVDAGEIGAGKTVTALYELTPVNKVPLIDPHRYEKNDNVKPSTKSSNELAFLRIRYKKPDTDKSILLEEPILVSSVNALEKTSNDFRFTASVAGFGQLLRDSKYISSFDFDDVITLAKSGAGIDEGGYRNQFIRLVKVAKELSPKKADAVQTKK